MLSVPVAVWVVAQPTGLEQWTPTLIPLGGFGLLLVLLLSYKLIHPRTLEQLLAEKDRQLTLKDEQIVETRADRDEWKAAYRASEEARAHESEARALAERRADAAVEAANLVADSLDRMQRPTIPTQPQARQRPSGRRP